MSRLIGRKKGNGDPPLDKLGGTAVTGRKAGYGSRAEQQAKEERRIRAKMKASGKTITRTVSKLPSTRRAKYSYASF